MGIGDVVQAAVLVASLRVLFLARKGSYYFGRSRIAFACTPLSSGLLDHLKTMLSLTSSSAAA